ncbi:hypothetical protein [Tissierella pigra]|uniref:hypothetical protein n=1 Tax=Tissierella pigra TaxID=2607614 RepID=UPI0018A6BCCA|nr:hypothetical protein [Tissierella pigra]
MPVETSINLDKYEFCRRSSENEDTLSQRIVGRSLVLHSDNGSPIKAVTIYLMNLVDIKMLDK